MALELMGLRRRLQCMPVGSRYLNRMLSNLRYFCRM